MCRVYSMADPQGTLDNRIKQANIVIPSFTQIIHVVTCGWTHEHWQARFGKVFRKERRVGLWLYSTTEQFWLEVPVEGFFWESGSCSLFPDFVLQDNQLLSTIYYTDMTLLNSPYESILPLLYRPHSFSTNTTDNTATIHLQHRFQSVNLKKNKKKTWHRSIDPFCHHLSDMHVCVRWPE